MSDRSKIEWTDATWNPVTGCTAVSPGCRHCYARAFAERFRGVPGHPYEGGFDFCLRPERLGIPLNWKKPRRIFVCSMSDLFQASVPEGFVFEVLQTVRAAHWHEFQILTKRARRMAALAKRLELREGPLDESYPNAWLGVTVESQKYVGRAETIAGLSSTVRYISAEPLLGSLDLREVLGRDRGINWVIVGGESGPKARPMQPEWVWDIRDQCRTAGVAFLFKQWGGVGAAKKAAGRLLDGRLWEQYPLTSEVVTVPRSG